MTAIVAAVALWAGSSSTSRIAQTAQHAGQADIIRESLDGAKSMG